MKRTIVQVSKKIFPNINFWHFFLPTGTMSEEHYRHFKQWYDEHKDKEHFHLPTQLRIYCRNDTDILMAAILAFRRIFIQEITGSIEILPASPTLASLVMNIYKTMFMPENEIALVPERGYERQDRCSVLAIRYLEWRSMTDQVDIQHAGNGGERWCAGYKLDGWSASCGKAWEIMGCYHHGCLDCYRPTDKLLDGQTAMELNERTQRRMEAIRATRDPISGNQIVVEEIWLVVSLKE